MRKSNGFMRNGTLAPRPYMSTILDERKNARLGCWATPKSSAPDFVINYSLWTGYDGRIGLDF
jgi:hypothetical protein